MAKNTITSNGSPRKQRQTPISQAIEQFFASYNHSTNTRQLYRRWLIKFMKLIRITTLEGLIKSDSGRLYQHIVNFVGKQNKVSSQKVCLGCLRSFLRYVQDTSDNFDPKIPSAKRLNLRRNHKSNTPSPTKDELQLILGRLHASRMESYHDFLRYVLVLTMTCTSLRVSEGVQSNNFDKQITPLSF